VLPGDPDADIDVDTQIEMLRDLPAEILLAELEELTGGSPTARWRPAVDKPRRWLDGYADLLQRAWSVMAPVWLRSRQMLDREIERMAVAAVRGFLDVALNDILPGGVFSDNAFTFPGCEPARFSVGSRGLVLKPMLTGPAALIVRLGGHEVGWIGYALPDAATLAIDPRPGGHRQLGLILGDVRTAILVALDRPTTMGRLSELVQHTPNAVTYHCHRLEASGLLSRRRKGREIYVQRTDKATALVDLFA
jgi:hypothetical protein